MEKNGDGFADKIIRYRNRIQSDTLKCNNLEVIGKNVIDDASKVCIYIKNGTMTGQKLYDILREEYHLQLEMAGERHALAIITGWDTDDGIERLIKAIVDIDKRIGGGQNAIPYTCDDFRGFYEYRLPERVLSLNEAWDAEREIVEMDAAIGHIAGEFINLYPPGIPIIVPGERINNDVLNKVETYLCNGMNVQGVISKDRKGFICVKQK